MAVTNPPATGYTTTQPPPFDAVPLSRPPATYPTTQAVAVKRVELRLVDRSRATVSRGRRLAPWRVLTTSVWYPEGSPGPRPLVIFAHGYRVGLSPYRRVCRVWAQRGFVVAAPSFPLTDQGAAGPFLDERDVVNQPADVSFVITQLLAANTDPGSPLNGRIDRQHIAVAGHSDGADTALAIAYLPASRDARVRAVIADAPDALPLPENATPLSSRVPLLLVHGDADTTVPFADSLRVENQLRTPGWFLALQGADHLPPIAGGSRWTNVFDQTTADFLRGELGAAADLAATLNADVTKMPASLQPLAGG